MHMQGELYMCGVLNQSKMIKCSSLFILLLIHFFQTCRANCNPSACGIIRNISYPFRLKDDHKHCGERGFELACENNVTFFYLSSQKYYVKEIKYDNSSFRLVDTSISSNDTCSFPTFSLYDYNFHTKYPTYFPNYPRFARPIYFVSCPLPLKNSSLFIEITHDCASSNSNSSSIPTTYTYVRVHNGMRASEVPYTCRLDLIAITSWGFDDLNNVSLSEIHHSLLYGFQLYYKGYYVGNNNLSTQEKLDVFFHAGSIGGTLMIILAIVALLSAVITPLVMIIIGFAVVLGLSFRIAIALTLYWYGYICFLDILPSFIMICAPWFIICPFVVWLLIHKFRRRHWSSFEGIESFLQSDNTLTPIRYSYSDIKKITRGFRDKLGEGGFGCVYKGKLRSGNDVAVKLLGKSGASGQDFMNEIATIGRIHHVNIVKLVGYCTQGSKRALVYDFMPNSSLEKYLFNREKMNSLNWDTKFEIAIGVARGIEYLHQGCDIQILHFDIKPHNILLDDKFIPKISDFGLAKFCATDKKTVTMTAARGTIGYVAPELISRSIGAISYKADVYSFGMLLMELVGLNRDLKGNNDDSGPYFPYWIYDHINQGKYIEIGKGEGNNDDENDSMRKLGRKMTIVALWCIQMNPDDRPSMNKVLRMLEADVERLKIPDYPSQSIQIVVNMDDQSGITCTTDSVPFQQHDDASSCFQITVQD